MLFSAVIAVTASSFATADIAWNENLRSAHAKAQTENKLLLLHFYSDNCVWCDRLEAGAFKAPIVDAAVSENYIPVKIHAGKNPQLVEMFKVKAFPTDVIVTTNGKTISHTVSPQAADRYVAMLQSAVPLGIQASASPSEQHVAAESPAAPPAPTTPHASTTPHAPAPQVTAAPASANMSGEFAGGAKGILAGSRTDAMTLGMPSQVNEESLPEAEVEPLAAAEPAAKTTGKPDQPGLAMEGFCAVTVIKEDRWVEGRPDFGVIHLGKLYLFASAEAMETFLADPVTYTPVLNEIDVVRFFEERRIVPGKREWGLKDPTHNRMFFFADEAAMNHFWNEHHRYTDAAIKVMDKAVKDANPGT
ncbi:DUF255 domain-containing protein [Novipirellula caenicola]